MFRGMEKLMLQLPAVQFVAGLVNATLKSTGASAVLLEDSGTTLLDSEY